MTREAQAVRKAGGRRLLADMRQAAELVGRIYQDSDRELPRHTAWARGYVLGAVEGTSRLSLRACLLTAFGG